MDQEEVGLGVLKLRSYDSELVHGLKCAHQRCLWLQIIFQNAVQVPIKVEAETDVHVQQNAILDVSIVMLSCDKEAMEDAIIVGGHDEVPDGQVVFFLLQYPKPVWCQSCW